jgi:hypothetical protein
MGKKNRIKKIFESMPLESAEAKKDLAESAQAEAKDEAVSAEQTPPEAGIEASENEQQPSGEEQVPPQAEMETPTSEQQSSGEEPGTSASAEEEISPDDLLEDVRRSLIEDEIEQEKKPSKWWRRIGKEKKARAEQPVVKTEIDLPAVPTSTELTEEQLKSEEPQEYLDEIDELIDMLETESDTTTEPAVTSETAPAEPEPEIDFEELKKQALSPRAADQAPEDSTEVRSIALSGDEEVFVEVQSQVSDPLEERLSAFENSLKPYRRYINIALALLGLVAAVIASLILYSTYQRSLPPPPTPEVSNLPYPTSVSLPGGWSFNLGKGTLQDGEWNPRGAEWLQGTEVCRWVSLPWSLQLEAVLRTLNENDPIELGMSNNDKFTYEVDSIRQLSPEQMQELDSNSPCLLIILTQSDSDQRWVLTALP